MQIQSPAIDPGTDDPIRILFMRRIEFVLCALYIRPFTIDFLKSRVVHPPFFLSPLKCRLIQFDHAPYCEVLYICFLLEEGYSPTGTVLYRDFTAR